MAVLWFAPGQSFVVGGLFVMQMIDVWYISFLGASAIGVVPFDFCLKALPRFIREVAHPLASTPSTVCCDAPRAAPETSDPIDALILPAACRTGGAGGLSDTCVCTLWWRSDRTALFFRPPAQRTA